ncbi:MAG: prenyltransferase/squalene oxidase repeat-containing protein [Phycisphaerales bacterium JB063]
MTRPIRQALIIFALLCGVACPVVASAQGGDDEAMRDQTQRCIDNAMRFLISQAQGDGSIGNEPQNRNAMTALTVMAMVAVGHQPTDHTPEGKLLRDALNFILRDDRQSDEGYYGYSDGSRMYGHGITTLMLCEMMGMGIDDTQDALIQERAQKAIDLILRSQRIRKREDRYNGGWRYDPDSRDSDLSVTVWQLMALRAGKAGGLDVPSEAIDEAVAYLERSYREVGREQGGFGYEPGQSPRYATTAAGMLAMLVCGEYEHEQVAGASQYLVAHPPTDNRNDTWFYYGTYYYAMGMYQVGGGHADDAEREVFAALSRSQQNNGSWTSNHFHERNPVYATCMAVLALSVRHHFLPIYQR